MGLEGAPACLAGVRRTRKLSHRGAHMGASLPCMRRPAAQQRRGAALKDGSRTAQAPHAWTRAAGRQQAAPPLQIPPSERGPQQPPLHLPPPQGAKLRNLGVAVGLGLALRYGVPVPDGLEPHVRRWAAAAAPTVPAAPPKRAPLLDTPPAGADRARACKRPCSPLDCGSCAAARPNPAAGSSPPPKRPRPCQCCISALHAGLVPPGHLPDHHIGPRPGARCGRRLGSHVRVGGARRPRDDL